MYDIIGNIAVIHKKDKNLVKKILKNKNVYAVYHRGKIHGRLRIPKLRWLAGKKIYETTHKESGCKFRFDLRKCFFSPRLGTDRLEIANKVRKNEEILVMFSGIAPYPIIISKHSKAKKIYCVELGKDSVRYANDNIKMNKIDNIVVLYGDVRKVVPTLHKKFDRIVMSRPQLKETFLKEAFIVSKKGTLIHYYDFEIKKKIHEIIDLVEKEAKKAKKKIKILDFKPIREIAPYKYNVRLDFKVI
jgi:tRNA (guanine37-N1)-methyltransferase